MVFAYEVKAYTISICPKKFRETANGFCIQYKVSRCVYCPVLCHCHGVGQIIYNL